jgi:hypothetical protein
VFYGSADPVEAGLVGMVTLNIDTGQKRLELKVDHGTIRGRSCVDCGHYKPLSTCVDRIFVKKFLAPASKKKTQPVRLAAADSRDDHQDALAYDCS